MKNKFKALLLTQDGKETRSEVAELDETALPEGDVLVSVEYSSLNYKDALAVTGKGKIIRTFPMVPGIDLAGTVIHSASPQYAVGDRVVLTGWGVGERHWGGYSQVQRVRAEWLTPLPDGLDTRAAMAIGTAGFTAMLCVMTLIEAGIKPTDGKVLVTGAAGGVGSIAVSLLSKLSYNVAALVPADKAETHTAYLKDLGADDIVVGPEWSTPPNPLEKQRWAAAIDTVGSIVLARALAEVNYGGAVAACGLAGGADLPTTVMPFILRGVRLLGVDSVMCPAERRVAAWRRIAKDISAATLSDVVREIALEDVPQAAQDLLARKSRGRAVVRLS